MSVSAILMLTGIVVAVVAMVGLVLDNFEFRGRLRVRAVVLVLVGVVLFLIGFFSRTPVP